MTDESFGVRLQRSLQPIDLSQTPRDTIFRSYTVYLTREREDDRDWFELRLGFFRDEVGAEQVARYLRGQFSAAVVVPVDMQEQQAALTAARRGGGFTPAVRLASSNAAASRPMAPSAPAVAPAVTRPNGRRLMARPTGGALEESLRALTSDELANSEDDLSSTGVRHLKIEVQRVAATRNAKPSRWRMR